MEEHNLEDGQPIVSSSQLAEDHRSLSEFEYAVTLCGNAFQRWTARCMAASGYPQLNALDIQILHLVGHRDREKRLQDLCFLVNIEENHIVNYSLKKLAQFKLVSSKRKRKELFYSLSSEGRKACAEYREVRKNALLATLSTFGDPEEELKHSAQFLRLLSGMYEQAARAASSL